MILHQTSRELCAKCSSSGVYFLGLWGSKFFLVHFLLGPSGAFPFKPNRRSKVRTGLFFQPKKWREKGTRPSFKRKWYRFSRNTPTETKNYNYTAYQGRNTKMYSIKQKKTPFGVKIYEQQKNLPLFCLSVWNRTCRRGVFQIWNLGPWWPHHPLVVPPQTEGEAFG